MIGFCIQTEHQIHGTNISTVAINIVTLDSLTLALELIRSSNGFGTQDMTYTIYNPKRNVYNAWRKFGEN